MEKEIGYPMFVKPANAGSSVGISKVNNEEELAAAIDRALAFDDKVLVEQYINGREIESSVIGNRDIAVASSLGEIISANEFYDYDAKYADTGTKLLIAPELSRDTEVKLKRYASRAYEICECRGLARVDFFVERTTGEVFLNEINTIPGFTSICMYPKMWEASGVRYGELLDKLIELAMKTNN